MKNKFLILLSLITSTFVFAGECNIKVTRTACKGMEVESYSKCPGGTRTCISTVDTSSVESCKNFAIVNCINSRTEVTKYKFIQVNFDGLNLNNGEDFCKNDQSYLEADGSKKIYQKNKNYPHLSLEGDLCAAN